MALFPEDSFDPPEFAGLLHDYDVRRHPQFVQGRTQGREEGPHYCSLCGVPVPEFAQPQHSEWHVRLGRVIHALANRGSLG